jgi:hypothetical protein
MQVFHSPENNALISVTEAQPAVTDNGMSLSVSSWKILQMELSACIDYSGDGGSLV